MKDESSLEFDDEFDSDESSIDSKDQNSKKEASFTTENIINYGKEYEKLDKIYSKKEIALFNKLLEIRKINKLNTELDLYKKEKISWKFLYNNIFKLILHPINFNKIDINKNINIHEITQRIKYCVHCISTIKDKNISNEKLNLIPKIIDIFSIDNKKKVVKNYGNKKNMILRSNSHENFIFEENGINKYSDKNNNIELINHKKSNKIDINNYYKNNNTETKQKRKNKSHATIIMGAKSQEKLLSKNPLINKDIRKSIRKSKNTIIIKNIEKKNDTYENIIKSIPKLSDNNLFETKKKKANILLKRDAFEETMDDFNLKNLNIDIKDKTFCENFYFFPIRQNYDKENNLEKRGELIYSYKKMTDNLIDLLNI